MTKNLKKLASRRGVMALALAALIVLAAVGTSLATGSSPNKAPRLGDPPAPNYSKLFIGTGKIVNDSGLLAVIEAKFQALHPDIALSATPEGTGKVLTDAKSGAFAAVLVHDPVAETAFDNLGYGSLRIPFLYNYYTIVGPKSDPAHVLGSKTAVIAFKKIAAYAKKRARNWVFVSRGDMSGTNTAELALWVKAGVIKSAPTAVPYTAPFKGYKTVGGTGGPAAQLQLAQTKGCYTFIDTSDWVVTGSTIKPLKLKAMIGKTADLKNQYDIVLINQSMFSGLATRTPGSDNTAGAEELAAYLVSAQGQHDIAHFGWSKYHVHLFFPDAYTLSAYPAVASPPAP